jgi:hypothetical protein
VSLCDLAETPAAPAVLKYGGIDGKLEVDAVVHALQSRSAYDLV